MRITSRQRVLLIVVTAFVVLFVLLFWHSGVIVFDYYSAYSGVIVSRGEEVNLFCETCAPEQYIVLEDAHGMRSRRYVGTINGSLDGGHLETGRFVVKEKGFGHFPHEPGRASALHQKGSSSGFVLAYTLWLGLEFVGFVLAFTLLAALIFAALRKWITHNQADVAP